MMGIFSKKMNKEGAGMLVRPGVTLFCVFAQQRHLLHQGYRLSGRDRWRQQLFGITWKPSALSAHSSTSSSPSAGGQDE